ncbi:MAG: beta-ketoacyl-ACP synthase III [Candidatus Marinimicrobia bacterium]|nr:beta-ketoacyl-ACP synthase III [Candidatus Neomarinimicrobiota bacterium]
MGLNKGSFRVVSSGRYAPEQVLSNRDLEKIVDTTDAWIRSRTGIGERRIANGKTTTDMAALAAQNAIDKADYDKDKIDLIIVATFTSDMKSPSVASRVQAMLGLEKAGIMVFDLNAACTGFIYALNVAERMLHSGSHRSALVIGAEVLSKVTDYKDRNTCVLFGDGAGAVIVERDETKEAIFNVSSKSDRDLILSVRDYISMDGPKVYQFASRVIESSVTDLLEYGDIPKSKIKKIVPHQANIRIIKSASKALGIPMEFFFVNIHKYGNTSAASVPLALDEMLEAEPVEPDDKVILVDSGPA